MPSGFNIQNPYAAQEMEIARRQKLAQMLQQQAMQPIQASQGGAFAAPASPLQVIGNAMLGYAGKKQGDEALQRQQNLQQQMQQDRAAALAKALQASQAQPMQMDAADNVQTPAMPADPSRGMAVLADAGMASPADVFKMQQQMIPKPPAPPQPFTLSPGAKRFDPQGNVVASVPPNQPNTPDRSPYFMPIQTAQGIYAFNARTGEMELVRAGGQPVVGSASDPRLQGQLAGAKESGKAAADLKFNMQGIGGIIQTADDILSGVKRGDGGVTAPTDLPTQSGIGTIADTAAGFFGMSPQGAAQAQQLKAIAGALTVKMPRMQGPQSDKDVLLYRQMAAEVGDSTIPIARRKAALDTVKQLWSKYEHLNPDAFLPAGGGAPQPTPAPQPAPAPRGGGPARIATDADYDALPPGTEFIGPDGKLRRKP